MKRFFASLVAVLLLVAGIGLTGLGSLGIAIFGTDGVYSAPVNTLASSDASVAVIADLAGVTVGIPFHDRLGQVTISVRSTEGADAFLGLGSQQDVDAYLFGQPYDLATKDTSWDSVAVPGIETTIAAPEDQSFWIAQNSGSTATVPLPAGEQPQTLVIMNVDGSPTVAVQAWLGFTGDRIFPISAAAVGAGLILIIVAVALLVRIIRRRRRKGPKVVVVAEPRSPEATVTTSEPASGSERAQAQADRAPS